MELRQLKTFRTVATLLSFNRAAEVLNYAQSTISAQIKALEEDLEVKLFDRLGKGIVLTEAGELLSQYAQKMLDIEAETMAGVKGRDQPQGSLTIRAPQSIGNTYLAGVVGAFRKQFPKVSFNFHTCAFHSLEHELQTGVTDLAFLLGDSINSASLVAEPLRFEQLLMVSNPDNPLTQRTKVSIKDLADQPIFLAKSDCGYRMTFEQMLTEANIKPQTVLEFNSVELLKACLAISEGVTMIPEITVRAEIARGELSVLRWEEELMETAVLMIRHKEKWLSPSLQSFLEISRDIIGNG
ncbi:LysR family transcriptional regulator [Desulfomonile tiedjei]|uniref:Transcriptional regulator n=1 Tax=Desulfomonile tiedjei (strain ATCC 49306 / DSM 6799 / DCB-1) TaxID=706587 RepID=I4CBC0_DESTA|nr:LysR family transcriptional regulator [Desulfomonile tiedjei]AFM26861.1 transcriptional regulator [Desulfomonile tiedjei DSM 6799]